MSRIRFSDFNEHHDRLTTPLIRKRNEQASAYYRQQLSDLSRPSSSSGSVNTLRRTPRFDDPKHLSRARANSFDSPPRLPSPQRQRDNRTASPGRRKASPHHRRAASAHPTDFVPHPALRISNRTHSAVLYALEEALRKPNPFTADLEEESAQMSDLGGGRASNGGARTGGPVPVPSGTPTGLKTPRDVMRNRQEREARRQEEAKAEEQRRLQLAQERRYSAERRAAGQTSYNEYPADAATQQGGVPGNRNSGSGFVASGADYGVPTGRGGIAGGGDSGYASAGASAGGPTASVPHRRTVSSSVAQDQPRPAQPTAGPTRRPVSQSASAPGSRQGSGAQQQQQAGSGAQPGAPPSLQPPPPLNVGEGQQGSRSSTFPHAFERWEQLSSHWEGLTSYWLRKLESDAEDIQRSVPSASAMSRQITDLSAAGANLFHAVVELQRLRASSERKFQRWFFETRTDTERNHEVKAQLEQELQAERAERQKAAKLRVESDIAAENARREVAEMRRELMISKEEARRAWEELGRRNQDSLDLAESLKAGRITVVSGVQVVPYFGGPSRTGSASQHRPTTREGMPYGGTPGATSGGAAVLQSPGEEDYYHEEPSPTNTDPFTESKRMHYEPTQHQQQQTMQNQPMHHDQEVSSLAAGTYQPYPMSSPHDGTTSAASGASAQTAIPMQGQRPGSAGQRPSSANQSSVPRTHNLPIVSSDGQFYQHQPQETYLHSSQPDLSLPGVPQNLHQQSSYVTSEGDNEYSTEQPSGYRRGPHQSTITEEEVGEEEDDYDTAADVRREAEIAARYRNPVIGTGGGAELLPEAPTIPATSAQAMASYEPSPPPTQQLPGPDYEGEGYGEWDTLRTAHHHPTRLSDVLEEEEERSSRRTAGE